MTLQISGSTIGYDVNGMQKLINDINVDVIPVACKTIRNESQKVRTTLDTVWVGASAEAFKDKIERDTTSLCNALVQLGEEITNELNNVGSNVEDYDAAIASQLFAGYTTSSGGSSFVGSSGRSSTEDLSNSDSNIKNIIDDTVKNEDTDSSENNNSNSTTASDAGDQATSGDVGTGVAAGAATGAIAGTIGDDATSGASETENSDNSDLVHTIVEQGLEIGNTVKEGTPSNSDTETSENGDENTDSSSDDSNSSDSDDYDLLEDDLTSSSGDGNSNEEASDDTNSTIDGNVTSENTDSSSSDTSSGSSVVDLSNTTAEGTYSGSVHTKSKATDSCNETAGVVTTGHQNYTVVADGDYTGAAGTISQSDYMYLIAQVAGESGNSADDMLGVATTIINRLEAGGEYGSSVTDVLEKGYWPWGKSCNAYLEGGQYYNTDWGQEKLELCTQVVNDVLNGTRNLNSDVYYYYGNGDYNSFSDVL